MIERNANARGRPLWGFDRQFDPSEVQSDPYPFYAYLRSHGPVHWAVPPGAWILSRWKECHEVLRDPRFSNDARNWSLYQMLYRDAAKTQAAEIISTTAMLFLDPPDHTRLRALVKQAFSARTAEGMRGYVQRVVDDLLDRAAEAGGMDVVSDLGYPLPTTVICEMLGIPAGDRGLFRQWTTDAMPFIDPVMSSSAIKGINESMVAFRGYFEDLIEGRRRAPRDDLLSALLEAEQRGDRLTVEEVIGTCILLLIAGYETTANMIPNGLLALLRNPDQLRLLQEDPDLIRGGTEELIRYDSSVQLVKRIPLRDTEIGGHRIDRGTMVWCVLGAANRDPDQFPEPDRLDVTREDVHHLSFSEGAHHCLGAPLARIEMQVAVGTIIRRFPNMRLLAEPEWRDNISFRAMATMPVEF
jgi:pimeloyl-[acyl-carrier protein] synthase